jgi:N-acetylglucosamine kinase-like BadF-type ATPase
MTYQVGIDGGGTKTELILVDAAGAIVAQHLAPGCNPSQIGPEKARAIVTDALAALLAQSKIENLKSKITASLFCMAGNRNFWRDSADALTGYGKIITTDDSQPVLELATEGKPGLVLHAGTGSFVAARAPDGSIHYAGGLGWKLGDPGSGFDLGRRAIALAMLELRQGATAAPSPLVAALRAHTGLADYPANSHFFYNDAAANAQIAAFAPRVIELAAQDCGPAQQVLADSITDLARQADDVIHRLFPSPAGRLPCGVSGRILNSAPAAFALRSLTSKLNWPVELHFITLSPIEGVRRLLMRAS